MDPVPAKQALARRHTPLSQAWIYAPPDCPGAQGGTGVTPVPVPYVYTWGPRALHET